MAEILGEQELMRRLERIERNAPDEFGRALYQEALIEEKESRRRTPVDLGTLRASHETSRPKADSSGISVTISVGGPAALYAIYVHENLEAYHKVGQAKFLESTLMQSRPHMARRIANRIDLRRMAR
jgi:hypothetical protein